METTPPGRESGPPASGSAHPGGLGPDRIRPELYWERRLGGDFSLKGVGYQALGRPFNEWAYRVRKSAVRRTLRVHQVALDRTDVLDIGFGTGFFVELWTHLGARSVAGIDLTQRAVDEVSSRFPQHRFFRQDLTDPHCPTFGSFDLVTIFDVLFHILDDGAFEIALTNACRQVRAGGLLLITDILSSTETIEGLTQRSRPLLAYRRVLDTCGFRGVGLHPVFFTMSLAPDVTGAWARRLSSTYWGLMCALLGKAPRAGHVIGPLGYAMDRALQGVLTRGPSVKILVARRGA